MRLSTLLIAAAAPVAASPVRSGGSESVPIVGRSTFCDANLHPVRKSGVPPRQNALVPVQTRNDWALAASRYAAAALPVVMSEAGVGVAWLSTAERAGGRPELLERVMGFGAIAGLAVGGTAALFIAGPVDRAQADKVAPDHCRSEDGPLVGIVPPGGSQADCHVAAVIGLPTPDHVTLMPVPERNDRAAGAATFGTFVLAAAPVVAGAVASNVMGLRRGLQRPARLAASIAGATVAGLFGGAAAAAFDTAVAGPERRKPRREKYCHPADA